MKPRSENRQTASVRISPEAMDLAKRAARSRNVPVSEYIEEAIVAFAVVDLDGGQA